MDPSKMEKQKSRPSLGTATETIKLRAKKLMDEFMTALESVKSTPEVLGQSRELSTRKQKKPTPSENLEAGHKAGPEPDHSFRDLMLKNAPKIKDGCILAEKKTW